MITLDNTDYIYPRQTPTDVANRIGLSDAPLRAMVNAERFGTATVPVASTDMTIHHDGYARTRRNGATAALY